MLTLLLGRLRQGDEEFKARPCPKIKSKIKEGFSGMCVLPSAPHLSSLGCMAGGLGSTVLG